MWLLFVAGSSLCGLADSDAVLYICCGWDAGIHAHGNMHTMITWSRLQSKLLRMFGGKIDNTVCNNWLTDINPSFNEGTVSSESNQ